MMDLIVNFTCDEAGTTAVEYAFLVSFIALAIIASVTTFGGVVKGFFNTFNTKWAGS